MGGRLVILVCGWQGRGKQIPLPSLGWRSHGGEDGRGDFFINLGLFLKKASIIRDVFRAAGSLHELS
jgi:hypothetical protein